MACCVATRTFFQGSGVALSDFAGCAAASHGRMGKPRAGERMDGETNGQPPAPCSHRALKKCVGSNIGTRPRNSVLGFARSIRSPVGTRSGPRAILDDARRASTTSWPGTSKIGASCARGPGLLPLARPIAGRMHVGDPVAGQEQENSPGQRRLVVTLVADLQRPSDQTDLGVQHR